jgi:hypothetical protein
MNPSQKVFKREPVEPTVRLPMTPARRLRLYIQHEGRCGICKVKVPLRGTTMDHALQLWMSGEEKDENLRPLCPKCDKPKTAKDASDRAKVRGMRAFHEGTKPDPKRKLKGRGFGEQSRPFPKRRGASLRASPDGSEVNVLNQNFLALRRERT